MKSLTCLAATALALCAFTYGANAATVTDSTMPIGPDVNLQPNSESGTGNFNGAQLGSVGDKTTSPYDNSTSFYSVCLLYTSQPRTFIKEISDAVTGSTAPEPVKAK